MQKFTVIELTSFDEPVLPAPNWSYIDQKGVNICRMAKIILAYLLKTSVLIETLGETL